MRLLEFIPLPNILTASNNALLWRVIIGSIFLFVGSKINNSAKREMNKVGVTPPHGKPVKNLVSGGVFKYTRNPLYVSLFTFTIGFSIIFDNWLMMAGIIPQYIYLQFLVIPAEEKGLIQYFGDIYQNYRKKVPRWLIGDFF